MIDEIGLQRWITAALTVEMARRASERNKQHLTWKNYVVKRIVFDTIGGRITIHLASSAISNKTFPETIFDPIKCKNLLQFRSVFARYFSNSPDPEVVKQIKKKNGFDDLVHMDIGDALEEAKHKVLSLQ